MISLDTNVLARYYVDAAGDAEAATQRPLALALMASGTRLFVARTVVIELAWVLRSVYGFGPPEIARVLTHLAGLPGVAVEDEPLVRQAIELHRRGLDFADAMHFAASSACSALATFDQQFARRANKLALAPPVSAPAASG